MQKKSGFKNNFLKTLYIYASIFNLRSGKKRLRLNANDAEESQKLP